MFKGKLKMRGDTEVITYDSVIAGDLYDLTECYERYLNSGETVRSAIRHAFEENVYFGVKAEDEGRGIGYFTFQEDILFTYPHEKLEETVRSFVKNENTVTVDALMVADRYRGRGIAGRLAEKSLEMLRERGVRYMMVEIWVYPDGRSPARRVYEKMGKTVWSSKEELFYKDADKYGISCPICGKKCVCGAYIEIIEVV